MSSFAIRPATQADARDIAEIHYAGWQNAYGDLVPAEQMVAKQPERRVPFWQARIADAAEIVLIAHDATGRAQGFIHGGKVVPHDIRGGSLAGFDCEIYVLHCRKETQGKGLGRLLMAEIARAFQRRGGTALMLWAYTDNAYRPFYDRIGGEVVATGDDEGVADVAYGWRSLRMLAGTPPRPALGTGTGTGAGGLAPMTSGRQLAILAGFGLGGIAAIAALNAVARLELANVWLMSTGLVVICGALIAAYRLRSIPYVDDPKLRDPNATFVMVGPWHNQKRHALLSLGISVGSAFIMASGMGGFIGTAALLGTILFGISIPAFLLTRRNSRQVAFSPEGIDYSFFGFGPVEWGDLRDVVLGDPPRNALVLLVVDEEKYLSCLSPSARAAFLADRAPLAAGFHISSRDLGLTSGHFFLAVNFRMDAFRDRLTSYEGNFFDIEDGKAHKDSA